MTISDLGGRLPLLRPEDLTAEQKAVYDLIEQTMVPWAEKAGFQSRTADGSLIGPFNAILHSPAITTAFLKLQDVEGEATSLGARVRQVVILSVGAVWRSPYELYAHSAVAQAAGLPDATIRDLVAGGLPDGLDEAEKVATLFTRRLTGGHRVDDALYARAEAAFGPEGLVNMMYLAGCYNTVCGLLNAFQVPAPSGEFPAAWVRAGKAGTAKLETAALFPVQSFLENLAVRSDNSVLVTNMNTQGTVLRAATYRRRAGAAGPAPHLRPADHGPGRSRAGPVPGVHLQPLHDPRVVPASAGPARVDARRRRSAGAGLPLPDTGAWPERQLPARARRRAGRGLLRRADLASGRGSPRAADLRARVWLRHESMGYFPGKLKPEQPGVNGVRYAARTSHLYYTATAKKLLMRVAVDPATLEPAGAPELVVAGRMGDDFCIDEDAGVLYLTTHRQNTIDRISMDPGDNSGFPQASRATRSTSN